MFCVFVGFLAFCVNNFFFVCMFVLFNVQAVLCNQSIEQASIMKLCCRVPVLFASVLIAVVAVAAGQGVLSML